MALPPSCLLTAPIQAPNLATHLLIRTDLVSQFCASKLRASQEKLHKDAKGGWWRHPMPQNGFILWAPLPFPIYSEDWMPCEQML